MTNPQQPPSETVPEASPLRSLDAFAAQYVEAYPRLTAVAAGVLGRPDGAEDVVQQAAGIAVAKACRFDSAPRFLAWMFTTVRQCALNQRRKLRRRRTYAADPSDLALLAESPDRGERLPVDPQSGQLHPDQTSFEDQLLEALQELGDDARCCLLLRTVHELSYAEISELLDIPAGTAMSHVHRSRQWLRRTLAASHAPADSLQD